MENFKFALSCILAVLVFQSSQAQQNGQPPQCVLDMAQDQGFLSCMKDFMTFLQNSGELKNGAAGAGQEDAMMRLMCSDEGKSAMTCMMDYVMDCPEISQQAQGMDFGMIMKEGGLDAFCQLITGPCKEVQECMVPKTPMVEGEGSPDMSSVKGANPFSTFLQQSALACGPMKTQYDCIMKHLKDCEAEVRQLEDSLKNVIEMAMQGDHAIASYDEFKRFMREECGKMPGGIAQDSCVSGSLTSTAYMNCYQNASDTYKMKKGEKCGLYELQSGCLDMYVGKDCGTEKANFMKENMNMIIQNVPASCTITDTSAASMNVQLAATTIFTLAISLFFTL